MQMEPISKITNEKKDKALVSAPWNQLGEEKMLTKDYNILIQLFSIQVISKFLNETISYNISVIRKAKLNDKNVHSLVMFPEASLRWVLSTLLLDFPFVYQL